MTIIDWCNNCGIYRRTARDRVISNFCFRCALRLGEVKAVHRLLWDWYGGFLGSAASRLIAVGEVLAGHWDRVSFRLRVRKPMPKQLPASAHKHPVCISTLPPEQ